MSGYHNNSIFWVETEKIAPNPFQPRREFEPKSLEDLADSIRQYGVLQPLVVTRKEIILPDNNGMDVQYELIAGERRLRASKIAGLQQVPVIIRKETDDKVKLELAIIENLQREDLNPIDRAMAFEQLHKEFGLTHVEIGKRMGKSRVYVSNSLRLLSLPQEIKQGLMEGRISEGHTRPLLMLIDRPAEQNTLYKEIMVKKLSVRDAEKVARKIAQDKVRKKEFIVDPKIQEFEKRLSEKLGTRVHIEPKENGGQITIDYFTVKDLEGIIASMKKVEQASSMMDSYLEKNNLQNQEQEHLEQSTSLSFTTPSQSSEKVTDSEESDNSSVKSKLSNEIYNSDTYPSFNNRLASLPQEIEEPQLLKEESSLQEFVDTTIENVSPAISGETSSYSSLVRDQEQEEVPESLIPQEDNSLQNFVNTKINDVLPIESSEINSYLSSDNEQKSDLPQESHEVPESDSQEEVVIPKSEEISSLNSEVLDSYVEPSADPYLEDISNEATKLPSVESMAAEASEKSYEVKEVSPEVKEEEIDIPVDIISSEEEVKVNTPLESTPIQEVPEKPVITSHFGEEIEPHHTYDSQPADLYKQEENLKSSEKIPPLDAAYQSYQPQYDKPIEEVPTNPNLGYQAYQNQTPQTSQQVYPQNQAPAAGGQDAYYNPQYYPEGNQNLSEPKKKGFLGKLFG